MLIHCKKSFIRGLLLLGSFFIILFLLFTPHFHNPKHPEKLLTGLEFCDELFNQLAKGSSNFNTDSVAVVNKEPATDKPFTLTVTLQEKAFNDMAVELATQAGLDAEITGDSVTLTGSLKPLLLAAIADSTLMYDNNGTAVKARYNNASMQDALVTVRTINQRPDEKLISTGWWQLLKPIVLELQLQKEVAASKAVNRVITRSVETGYNYYGIESESVSGKMLIYMIGLLIFYVLYTVWYGFAIFELFDGIGLTMSKSKINKEH